MSDNVKDELAELYAPGCIGKEQATFIIELLAERGRVVLGPDGEPLRIVDALRALGDDAWPAKWQTSKGRFHADYRPSALRRLAEQGITGPLADACLAAAEVEG